jgi:putative endonuclease
MYWIYVLKAEKYNKSYVGYTDNVSRRLEQHNHGQSNFSKRFLPWKLIHSESFETQVEALTREKFLKSRSGRIFLKEVIFKSLGDRLTVGQRPLKP